MKDAVTARNSANESVKNASEVKQALLKKRENLHKIPRQKMWNSILRDDVTYYGLRCKFCLAIQKYVRVNLLARMMAI